MTIKSALISVYHKDGLEDILKELAKLNVHLYSTGGTHSFIEKMGLPVTAVEELTSYPSILGGRVKTMHPKVFGGILARRHEDSDIAQLEEYKIPEIDLVIVDLYPFEETLKSSSDHEEIIEKIDIGGISLIRATAKNYRDTLVCASQNDYPDLLNLLKEKGGDVSEEDRKEFARRAFKISSQYDTAIFNYFDGKSESESGERSLRYGENPHQKGVFKGDLDAILKQLHGKELSYNNLVDIDAAINLVLEFKEPTIAIIKHTNACGLASRDTLEQAWIDALAGDPVSAFGGILSCNREVDAATATRMHELFFEAVIAPGYSAEALKILQQKKNRRILELGEYKPQARTHKTVLNGVIEQENDLSIQTEADLEVKTKKAPTQQEINDLLFANKLAKHIKSNTIVLARNRQLISMGSGQTSRVDALDQAIKKAEKFNFDLKGAVMASDAFFPFPDCVEIAHKAGITAVIQPGGSIKDRESIDYCDAHQMSMVMTGVRHFRH